jgi:drug/metabolite transporter (DMT)-like permease
LSATALSIVLFAALLHASWNAVVKAAPDRALTLAAVSGMHALAGVVLICTSGAPSTVSWLLILTSTAIHYAYYVFLFHAYRLGDLGQVYPISRGMAPALVALGAFFLIDEELTTLGWVGLGLVTFGIGLLALQRGAAGANRKAIGVAVLLGTSIAAYSVADGIGVRWSDNPTGYMGWLFLLESPVTFAILWTRKKAGIAFSWRIFGIGLVGGLFAVTAYGLVLYAKTIAPIGAVSAVRESSVIIAALIGTIVFHERPWKGRMIAAAVVAAGVLTLASSG